MFIKLTRIMKNLLACLFIILNGVVWAQTVTETTLDVTDQKVLSMDLEYGDAKISTWDKNEIYITTTVDINNGMLDEYFEIDVKDRRNEIHVKTELDDRAFKGNDFMVYKKKDKVSETDCKRKCKSSCKSNSYSKGIGNVRNKKNQSYNVDIEMIIKVPRNMILDITSEFGEIEIENPTEEVTVNSTFGGVKVIIDRNLKNDLELDSKFKFVDLTVAEDAQYDLNLYTEFGSLYTDFDKEVSDGMQNSQDEAFKQDIYTLINGGGPNVKLASAFGNVYLRKY